MLVKKEDGSYEVVPVKNATPLMNEKELESF